jgi:hypothetical protein
VTQEWNFAQLELKLAVLRIELIFTQSLKHNVEMPFMLFLVLRIDQDIINEDHDKLVQLCHEYRVHQIYEVSRGVDLQKNFFTDLDLMITQSKINL